MPDSTGSYFDALINSELPAYAFADPTSVTDTVAESAITAADNQPSTLQSLWGDVTSYIPALATQIKTSTGGVIGDAINAAKAKILSDTTKKLAARPDVQASIKQTAGNSIGNLLVEYWKEIALVGLVGLFFLLRKGR